MSRSPRCRRRRAPSGPGVLALLCVLLAACGGPGPDPGRAVSQNGWPVIADGRDERLVDFPWVTGRVLAGDVATVLGYVAARFDAEVEPIDVASSWGWANRYVRGSEIVVSNHASGTAIDLNAPAHPMGVAGTFTDAQVAALRAILDAVSPAVAWGGDFDRPDDMHLEIAVDAGTLAEVAARIAAGAV